MPLLSTHFMKKYQKGWLNSIYNGTSSITSFDFIIALQLQELDLNNKYFRDYSVIEGNGGTIVVTINQSIHSSTMAKKNLETFSIQNFI